jgi:hypothetical protein
MNSFRVSADSGQPPLAAGLGQELVGSVGPLDRLCASVAVGEEAQDTLRFKVRCSQRRTPWRQPPLFADGSAPPCSHPKPGRALDESLLESEAEIVSEFLIVPHLV